MKEKTPLIFFVVILSFLMRVSWAHAIPVTNPGFEQDFLGWQTIDQAGDSLFIDDTISHSGNKSAKLMMKAWGASIIQEVDVSFSQDTTVTFSLWLLMPTPGSRHNKYFTMIISALDSSGQVLSSNSTFPYGIFGPYPEWTKVSISVIAPNTTARIKIHVHTSNGFGLGGPDPLWIDDVELTADPIDQGVIGEWKFDEGTASDRIGTVDSSGNSNDASLKNGPQYVDGVSGAALEFDGIDNYVEVLHSASLNAGNAITVEFWLKTTQTNPIDGGTECCGIITKTNGDASSGWQFTGPDDDPPQGKIGFGIATGTPWSTSGPNSGTTAVNDGKWHHIAGTYDRVAGKIMLYVDGRLVGVASGDSFKNRPLDNSEPIWFGAPKWASWAGQRYWGALDEIRIYKRVLSADEVLARCLENAPPDVTCESAVSAGSVVINEVAWSGTAASSADEWIELYNTTSQDIDLTGWTLESTTDGTPNFTFAPARCSNLVIPAHGFFLLERTDDNTVKDIPADCTYTGSLANSGESLALKDPSGAVIDTANGDGGAWPAGTAGSGSPPYASMERIDPLAPDTDANWATNNGADRNGEDANGDPINGTPKALNSTINEQPVADAGADQTADEGEAVPLDGSGSFDPDNDPLSCTWDPGDGSGTLQGCTVTHTYADNGVYTATLSVDDGRGGSDQDTAQITINNVPPTVEAGPDQTTDVGVPVNFSGSFTDPGTADTHTIEWDFGDGARATGTLTPAHTYTAAGVYTVTLTVTDDDGGVGQDTLTVSVSAPTLAATKRLVEPGPWLRVGEELEYEIVITNTGTAAQPDNPEPEFRDPLPPNTAFVEGSLAATAGTALFDAENKEVRWDGELGPGESVTISFRVRVGTVPTGSAIENQGEALYDADGDGSNESSTPTDDPTTPEDGDPTRSPPVVLPGDPNGDGAIDVRDAILCAEGALALRTLAELQEAACDVAPPSGVIDGRDVVRIAETALGIASARATTQGSGMGSAEPIRLRWDNLNLAPGERAAIKLYTQDGIKGLQLGPEGALRFDPRAIRVLEVRVAEPYALLASQIDNARGLIRAMLVRFDASPAPASSAGLDAFGEIPLLELEVEAVGPPGLQTLLRLDPDLALNPELQAAEVAVEGGLVRIGPAVPLRVERFSVRPVGSHMRPEGYRFFVEGQGIRALSVQVFDLQGRTVFRSGRVGNGFLWRGLTRRGERAANGIYLYVITVYGAQGEVLRSEIRKLVLLR